MSGRVYYNENDQFAAQWLRNLISEGLIPGGEVDQRSITDVEAKDLDGFIQCHFFAGIAGWAYALDLAGWPADREVWTGSCPCQPLSSAGLQRGHVDERHLWPAFHRLVAERQPAAVFGEQVASNLGREWFAGVRADLEGDRYALGCADLCAAGVGAPHIRQRLFWVAYADGGRARHGGVQRSGQHRQLAQDGGVGVGQADTKRGPRQGRFADKPAEGHGPAEAGASDEPGRCGVFGRLGDTTSGGRGILGHAACPRSGGHADGAIANLACGGTMGNADRAGLQTSEDGTEGNDQRRTAGRASCSPWSASALIPCADGKWRRVPANAEGEIEPILFPLVDGFPNRMGTLRGSGNAINPEIAAKFIKAAMECLP